MPADIRVLIAPNAFKESLSAEAAALAIARGLRHMRPITTEILPISDGGDGLIESLLFALGGRRRFLRVVGPSGKPVQALWATLKNGGNSKTAVIELAQASGLALLGRNLRSPMKTTTFGTGQLIRAALSSGCREIIIGMGGSATVDGGVGIAQALGFKFLNEQEREISLGGESLSRIFRIDTSRMDPRAKRARFLIACDVKNPLLGRFGAARTYGPQKGATPGMVEILERNLKHLSRLVRRDLGKRIEHLAGGGCAGGAGAGLSAFLRAKLVNGSDLVLKRIRAENLIRRSDWVITGEGHLDHQTGFGKAPQAVARLAKRFGVKTLALCGKVSCSESELRRMGLFRAYSILGPGVSLKDSIRRAAFHLEHLAHRAAREIFCVALFILFLSPVFAKQNPVETLQAYLCINTSNPPGDVSQAAEFLAGFLKKEGISSRFLWSDKFRGRVNLLAKLSGAGSKSPILLIHHMDVVPADAKGWNIPPFSGRLQGGEIWGRGALDDKAMGVAGLYALKRLKQKKVKLNRDIYYLAVCDEEIGGKLGAEWFVEKELDEIRPGLVWDEGGFLSDGIFSEDGRVYAAISVAEKKPFWLRLTARGRSGHGSIPHEQNPNDRLVRALKKVLSLKLRASENDVLKAIRKRIPRPKNSDFVRAITKNTISVTSLTSGAGNPPKHNVIPSEAAALLDVRLLPGESTAAFKSLLQKAISDPQVLIETVYIAEETPPSPLDGEFLQAISRVYQKKERVIETVPILLSGATDSRFFRKRGIPSYGFSPFLWRERELALFHADNERIGVEAFENGVELFYQILKELCADPPEVPVPDILKPGWRERDRNIFR